MSSGPGGREKENEIERRGDLEEERISGQVMGEEQRSEGVTLYQP